ncbi:MAG: hypothetical protein R3C68_09535 [Myxococcota bacterium]
MTGPLVVGLIQMADDHRRGEKPTTPWRVFDGMQRLQSITAFLIAAVSIGIAAFFFVLPGVILAILWAFVFHFIAIKECDAIEALRASWNLVYGNLEPPFLPC